MTKKESVPTKAVQEAVVREVTRKTFIGPIADAIVKKLIDYFQTPEGQAMLMAIFGSLIGKLLDSFKPGPEVK